MVLGRQHRVDQDPRCLVDPDGLVVFSRPVRRAREHLRLERDPGDVLARARDLGDPIVDDLQPDEDGAGFFTSAKINVPVAPGAPEESG